MKNLYLKTCRYVLIVLCAALFSGCGQDAVEEVIPLSLAATEDYAEDAAIDAADENDSTIFVHICGEVVKPGVYELPEGSRLYELLQRAGGYTSLADTDALNQAQLLQDSQKIEVKSVLQETAGNGENAGTESALININSADANELQKLSGVGASRAADILEYRQKNGPFVKIEDIMKVPGIKEGMFSKIKDQITL